MMMRLLGWLLGARLLEHDDAHILMRLPLFLRSERIKQGIVSKIMADYRVKYPGKRLEPHIGDGLIRFDIRSQP